MPEPPEYSYVANVILSAFNVIARSRTYETGVALPLDSSMIEAYLNLHDAPCEMHIFVESIFVLDNLLLDKVHKRSQ
ncbi:hypothetical protein B9T31_08695 [Acinetobacter sp. ANC 4558]|nr:hypothetical protein B9T31_08695 [Acinetobacter sp. ANC 4558]